MTHKEKIKKYRIRMASLAIGYLISIWSVVQASKSETLSDFTIYAISVIPTLFILAFLWVTWKFVKSLDEYLRNLHTEAMMIGALVAIGIGGGWGVMELMADVQHLPIYYVLPIYFFVYGVSVFILKKRNAVKGCL